LTILKIYGRLNAYKILILIEKTDFVTFYCYISPVLTTPDTVRYTKHTCTLVRFQIMARYANPKMPPEITT
jgi:hypothetical protein